MLLDDKQVALNDLVVACQESIDYYVDAIERVEEPALRRLFERISTQRRASVEHLAAIIRDTGELPRAPYADREELHKIVTHVKAALCEDDGRTVFLNDRIEGERRLAGLVDDALKLEFDDDTRGYLETLRAEVGDAFARLDAESGDS